MNVRMIPGPLNGSVIAPPSKSVAHRALICAALSPGKSIISPVDVSKDMEATIGALTSMGARITRTGKTVAVEGIITPKTPAEVDCLESGSTLRFLLPVAAALGIDAVFTGSGRLPQRPLTPYYDLFPCKGIEVDNEKIPLRLHGQLLPGEYSLPGDVSSQFVTGLLFALPLLEGDSTIRLTTALESAPYIHLTLQTLAAFGISVFWEGDVFHIPGSQRYRATDYTVEADFSNAAFWLTAAALGNDVKLNNLSSDSLQGDRKILDSMIQLGAEFVWENGTIAAVRPVSHPAVIDARHIPDLVPILCVAAAAVPGVTRIEGTRRLKIKESDRAAAMADCLGRMGCTVQVEPDAILIHGGKALKGAVVSSYNDHRIAMAMTIASTLADGPVTIEGAESVDKSYPGFYNDFTMLGGVFHVI